MFVTFVFFYISISFKNTFVNKACKFFLLFFAKNSIWKIFIDINSPKELAIISNAKFDVILYRIDWLLLCFYALDHVWPAVCTKFYKELTKSWLSVFVLLKIVKIGSFKLFTILIIFKKLNKIGIHIPILL